MRRFLGAAVALLLASTLALGQSSVGTPSGGGGGSGTGGAVTQSGTWNVGLTGTLPAFAATPTFNVGSIAGIATDASVQAVKTALGSPLQAGGAVSITNLPATQAVSGTFWQATQPVSAVALPLPAGAATAANQIGAATYSDTFNASIAASAATPPVSHAVPSPNPFSKFNAYFFATNAATFNIEASVDGGASFFAVATGSITAGAPQFQTIPLTYGLYRAYLINQSASTAMTARVAVSFTAN